MRKTKKTTFGGTGGYGGLGEPLTTGDAAAGFFPLSRPVGLFDPVDGLFNDNEGVVFVFGLVDCNTGDWPPSGEGPAVGDWPLFGD